jgi:cytochrome c556
MMKKKSVATFLAIALVMGGAVTFAVSEGDGNAAIRARQAAMEDVGDAIKVLAGIAKKQQPFDAAVVKKNAQGGRRHAGSHRRGRVRSRARGAR